MLKTAKTWYFFDGFTWTFENALSAMTLTPLFARRWAIYLLTRNPAYDTMSYKSEGGRKVYTVTREELE